MENIVSEIMSKTGKKISVLSKETGVDRKYLGRAEKGQVDLNLEATATLKYVYKDILDYVDDDNNLMDNAKYEAIKQAQIEKNKNYKNIISSIIDKYGIDQSEISKQTGIDRVTISRIINGHQEVSGKNLIKIMKVYGDVKADNVNNEENEPDVANYSKENTPKSSKENPQLNEINVGLNETSVHSIIETNRNISRTLEKMVDTNAQFAELLKSILPPKTETYQGVHQDILSKMSQMLEYVVEIGSGKRWETKEDGIVELNKRFYGNEEVSQERDILHEKDK